MFLLWQRRSNSKWSKIYSEIIEGQQYGIIYDKLTRESGAYFSNIESDYGTGSLFDYRFEFKANGLQPDILTAGTVKIKCTPGDVDLATVVFSIPVAYNTDPPNEGGSVLVNFNKTIFAPGDSVVTNCQWLTEYNEIIDFPPDQYFTVEILDGSEFGTLYDPYSGTTSNYLQDVNNSFQVLTSAEIPGDSAKLKIRVTTLVDVSQPAGSINSGETEEQKVEKNGEGIKPNFVVIGEQIESFADVVVKKDELEILEPTASSEAWITEEARMPTVICKAKMKNYNGGIVKFRWEYWISNEFKRRNRKDKNHPYYDLCPRIGKTGLLGWSYAQNSAVTNWEVPFLKDSGSYYYKAIWYNDRTDLHPAYGCENSYA